MVVGSDRLSGAASVFMRVELHSGPVKHAALGRPAMVRDAWRAASSQPFLHRQCRPASTTSVSCDAVGGLVRVYVTHGVLRDAAAIAASLFLIVLSSILLGTALPFALAKSGIDPAHAGSSIQVEMVICTSALD